MEKNTLQVISGFTLPSNLTQENLKLITAAYLTELFASQGWKGSVFSPRLIWYRWVACQESEQFGKSIESSMIKSKFS